MISEVTVRVRLARPEDHSTRAQLIHMGFASYDKDAFYFFFFQELTLECCILVGAILFIWCGASARTCLLAPAAAAVLVAVAVRAHHRALAHTRAQEMLREDFGVVAEVVGALVPGERLRDAKVYLTEDLREPGSNTQSTSQPDQYAQVVGTASVARARDARGGAWLGSLAVHLQLRGRGVGGALCSAVAAVATRRGHVNLDTIVSDLQVSARSLLHKHGWESRGWYSRQVVGRALTLGLAHLSLDLTAHRV